MLDLLVPYPLIFTPQGMPKPACCPHMAQVPVLKGPEGLPGICWGGAYLPDAGEWIKTPAGWWLNINGHQPQHMTKLETHPRVMRWECIIGAQPDHFWRIPILLTRVSLGEEEGFVSALDRIWNGMEWAAPRDLEPLQTRLLSAANGVPLGADPELRSKAMREIAMEILSVGSWVDPDFLAATGWLSERLIVDIPLAACDLKPDMPDAAN